MKLRSSIILAAAIAQASAALCQNSDLTVPKSIEAAAAFSIGCPEGCNGTLYIVGPGQAIKRDVQSAQAIWFPSGTLHNAGHYMVVLSSQTSNRVSSLDVLPAAKPSELTFIAKPSRLPVALRDGITGTAYVFDRYRNLITRPTEIDFTLAGPSVSPQSHIVRTQEGAAWTQMDSTSHEGKAIFTAKTADVSSVRVVGQVPGDPCSLRFSARASGDKVELLTDPVRDCSGNTVSDGTIVTFTQLYNGFKSSVDVPLKNDIGTVTLPAHRGAIISVASGVVLGNQIRWTQ